MRLAVSFFFFATGVIFASWANRIPDIKVALGLDERELGSVLFAIPVGQLTAMALSGWLVNRFGSRRMTLVGIVLYTLGLVPLALANSVWALVVALFLFGVTSNLCNAAFNTQAIGAERFHGRTIMASFHALWSMGGFLGGLLSMGFVALGCAPIVQFASVAAVIIVCSVIFGKCLVRWDVKAGPAEVDANAGRGRRMLNKLDPFVLFLGVMGFAAMICEGCMYDWSGVYFNEVVCVPEGFVQLGYVVCLSAMTCGRLVSDRFVTRYGRRNVVMASGLLIFAGMMLAVLFTNIVAATIGFAIVGLGISSTVPICYSLAGQSKRVNSATAVTTVASVGYLGFLIGPPVIGHLAHSITLHYTFAVVSLMGVALAIGATRFSKNS